MVISQLEYKQSFIYPYYLYLYDTMLLMWPYLSISKQIYIV